MLEAILAAIKSTAPVKYWFWVFTDAALMATAFVASFSNVSRARILEDAPTARVRSAPQGYVELQGRAELLDGPAIIAPLTRTPCAWWSYTVEERSTNKRRWSTVMQAASEELFALQDGTDKCVIDPEGAQVFPMFSRRWYGDSKTPDRDPGKRFGRGRYRYTEKRIHAGDPLYALGEFRTLHAAHDYDTEQEVRELLREWKKDHGSLLARFDTNRDNKIDLEEWDAARAAALLEVQQHIRAMQLRPGLKVMSAPQDGRPYLLGALPQPQLATKLRRRAVGSLAMFGVFGLLFALLIAGRFGL